MTDRTDLDRVLGAYFADGMDELADRVIDAALDQIDRTPQRPVLRLRRRFSIIPISIGLAAAAVIAVLAIGGTFYLLKPDQPAVGGPSPAPTPTVSATSGAAEGGSGSAHYEITGPDAASGDVKFASSATSGPSSDSWGQSVIFEDGSQFIRIKFPHPGGCNSVPGNLFCGTVDITTATLNLRDVGWRATPLPGGPSCTWDIASVTANGGAGMVECTNAVNPTDPTTPSTVTITFTYHDPSG